MLKSFTNMVSGLVKSAFAGTDPYDVIEVNFKDLQKVPQVCNDGAFYMFREPASFVCVIYAPEITSRAFSLFRVVSDSEAMTTFSGYSCRLTPLYLSCPRVVCRDVLQELCDHVRKHPGWSSAHLASAVGLPESFKNPIVRQQLDSICEDTFMAPLHVAVEAGRIETIQELVVMGVKVDVADKHGDNVFHYAARCSDAKITQMLASKDPAVINQLNLVGESPLHEACLASQAENAEHLLRWGADPTLTMSGRYPIHCAMKVSSPKCVETLVKWNRDQLHLQDAKYGGTPLHWAKTREGIYTLCDLGCNVDAANTEGETALHIMIKKGRLGCVMALLSRGASADAGSSHGTNALHLAIMSSHIDPTLDLHKRPLRSDVVDNLDLVQCLIVFGSDVNALNEDGKTPRHMAATSTNKNKDQMIYLLHGVGASRCKPSDSGCTPACSHDGNANGTALTKKPHNASPSNSPKKSTVVPRKGKLLVLLLTLLLPVLPVIVYDSIVDDVSMAAAMTRSASATGSSIMTGDSMDGQQKSSGDRVLCLDGGGIRGLILIQILLALEKATGLPARNCFDWIGGTSTGGILALAIVHGKPIRYCQGLYFRLKNEVFTGKRPYDSAPLEKFMKREFGENTRMTDVEYPRVLVTAVMGDRHPSELHFFRNYDPPGLNMKQVKEQAQFDVPGSASETFIWRAARCSGAAPTYFRAMGPFLDGGLMANNPTLDVMTEIHEYNTGLKATGQGHNVRPLHVMVSLGTGRMPKYGVKALDVYRPEGLFDIAKVAFGATALGKLLVDQVTQSEGRPVDRARAWCSMIGMPYFRFSPQLSEEIPLDCHDDRMLINMLWETQCFIHENWARFEQLALLLTP